MATDDSCCNIFCACLGICLQGFLESYNHPPHDGHPYDVQRSTYNLTDYDSSDSSDEEPAARLLKPQYVYFLVDKPYKGEVKIGRTVNLDSRLRTFRTMAPKCYYLAKIQVEDYAMAERELHKKYAAFSTKRHVSGRKSEWFKLSYDDARKASVAARAEYGI